jgi:hypothetical protein
MRAAADLAPAGQFGGTAPQPSTKPGNLRAAAVVAALAACCREMTPANALQDTLSARTGTADFSDRAASFFYELRTKRKRSSFGP